MPDGPPKRSRVVRYWMTSPQVEQYLRAKLEHPPEIVVVKSGALLLTFFEDAVEGGKRLGLAVRNLAAADEPEQIVVCGFPVAAVEAYRTRLASAGRTMRVEA